jgi:hypothetical protein
MSIVVTPIPRLIDLAAPSFTLGTANAAGSAVTAVASDATLLAFDTTDPAAVAASAVVGSATTAPRRDHVHPGIIGESGTFTPIITDNGGTQGTYSRQVGNYTKNGDSVSYTIDIIVDSLGSMTGSDTCRLGGLPFTAGSGDKAFAVGYGNSLAITAGNMVSGWISGSSAVGLFVVWDATTGATAMTITQLSAGGSFKFFGTYNT